MIPVSLVLFIAFVWLAVGLALGVWWQRRRMPLVWPAPAEAPPRRIILTPEQAAEVRAVFADRRAKLGALEAELKEMATRRADELHRHAWERVSVIVPETNLEPSCRFIDSGTTPCIEIGSVSPWKP